MYVWILQQATIVTGKSLKIQAQTLQDGSRAILDLFLAYKFWSFIVYSRFVVW